MKEGTRCGVDVVERMELSMHYDRRFASVERECDEHVAEIVERQKGLDEHHERLSRLDVLRYEVGRWQRLLAEVELQIVRERLRSLALAAESQDVSMNYHEYRADLERLMSVVHGVDTSVVSEGRPPARHAGVCVSAAISSNRVLRVIETPNGGGRCDIDAATGNTNPCLDILRRRCQEFVVAHKAVIEEFDCQWLAAQAEREGHVGKARARLQDDLTSLQCERRRLASVLEGYLRLQSKHVGMQKRQALELEALRVRRHELTCQVEVVERELGRDVRKMEAVGRREAGMHLAYQRRAEVLERQGAELLRGRLEAILDEAGGSEAQLAGELQLLRSRCERHRRRRRLVVNGLKVELFVLNKKLTMLTAIAEQVSDTLVAAAPSAS